MAAHDDEKVDELLGNLDEEFAKEHLYHGDEAEAQAYVDRNPGLKERRNDEYNIYKEGIK